jgi:glutamate N-acetyltransferase/amino-acid N-acetyltransferase
MVEIVVRRAATADDAFKIAETVAHSNLVKTALFGEDANWGRIMAAAGRAGVAFDPAQVDIRFGEVLMVRDGQGCGTEAEAAATRILQQPELTIEIDLKAGEAQDSILTCDFSIDYVKINADYRS